MTPTEKGHEEWCWYGERISHQCTCERRQGERRKPDVPITRWHGSGFDPRTGTDRRAPTPAPDPEERCCLCCGESVTTNLEPVCDLCIPAVDIGHRAQQDPEGARDAVAKMLEPNGQALDVETHPDGSASHQYFAAMAGPFNNGAPVVVLGRDEIDRIRAAVLTPTEREEDS